MPQLLRGGIPLELVLRVLLVVCWCAATITEQPPGGHLEKLNKAAGIVDQHALERLWRSWQLEVESTCMKESLAVHRDMMDLVYAVQPRLVVLAGPPGGGGVDCGIRLGAAQIGATLVNVSSRASYRKMWGQGKVDMLVLDVTHLRQELVMKEASAWMADFTDDTGAFIVIGTFPDRAYHLHALASDPEALLPGGRAPGAAFVMEVWWNTKKFWTRLHRACLIRVLADSALAEIGRGGGV